MFFFKKKTIKYTYKQRNATNGYCEVFNMNLKIWFDITSKCMADFCFIVSVVAAIFSERLEFFQKDFSLWFLPFL